MKKLILILMMFCGIGAYAQTGINWVHVSQNGSNWVFDWDTVSFNRVHIGDNKLWIDSLGRITKYNNATPTLNYYLKGNGTYAEFAPITIDLDLEPEQVVFGNVSGSGDIQQTDEFKVSMEIDDPVVNILDNRNDAGLEIAGGDGADGVGLRVQDDVGVGAYVQIANALGVSYLKMEGLSNVVLAPKIGFNTFSTTEDFNVAADTLKFEGLDGTGSFLKRVGTDVWTRSVIAASDIGSGAALTRVDDTNVTLTLGGSPSAALLAATSLTLGWTGTLATSRGGWGGSAAATSPLSLSSGTLSLPVTANQLLYGTGTSVGHESGFEYDPATDHFSSKNWNAFGGTNTENFDIHIQSDGSRAENVTTGYTSTKTVLAIRRANGTFASSTPILNTEVIGDLSWGGYKATAWSTSSVAAIQAVATEDYDDSGTGTKLNFQVTPNNSTGVVTAVTIDQDSRVILENKLKEYNNAAPTNGQLLIGNTAGGTFDAGTITEGSALDVTNGGGSITLDLDINELTTDNVYDWDDDYTNYYDAGEAANNKIVIGELTRTNIAVAAGVSSPTDAQTIFFGQVQRAPTTTADRSKIYFSRACTITAVDIFSIAQGVAGSNENWSLYVRLNNTTDVLVETIGANTAERRFDNTSLSIAIAANDYIEIKMINPTWGTDPTNVLFSGNIEVK